MLALSSGDRRDGDAVALRQPDVVASFRLEGRQHRVLVRPQVHDDRRPADLHVVTRLLEPDVAQRHGRRLALLDLRLDLDRESRARGGAESVDESGHMCDAGHTRPFRDVSERAEPGH